LGLPSADKSSSYLTSQNSPVRFLNGSLFSPQAPRPASHIPTMNALGSPTRTGGPALWDEMRARGRQCGRAANVFNGLTSLARGILIKRLGAFAQTDCLTDGFLNRRVVKIHIRHRNKQRFQQEPLEFRVRGAQPPRAVAELRDSLGGVDQQILQNGGGFGLAADREIGAAGAFGSLFTLKAEHNYDSDYLLMVVVGHRVRGG
jgi:hypothetical protein